MSQTSNICPYCNKDLNYLIKKQDTLEKIGKVDATDALEHLMFCCNDSEDGWIE